MQVHLWLAVEFLCFFACLTVQLGMKQTKIITMLSFVIFFFPKIYICLLHTVGWFNDMNNTQFLESIKKMAKLIRYMFCLSKKVILELG